MGNWLAIVAYRCEVAGELTDSIDVQVRHFTAATAEEIEARVLGEACASHLNAEGATVTWPFARLLAIEPWVEPSDGAELIGFITGCREVVKWSQVGDE